MLTRDPKKRLTAADLLKHPWMRINGVASDVIITPEVRAPPPPPLPAPHPHRTRGVRPPL